MNATERRVKLQQKPTMPSHKILGTRSCIMPSLLHASDLATVIALSNHGARQFRQGSLTSSASIFQRATTLLRSLDPEDVKDEMTVLPVKDLALEPIDRATHFVWHSSHEGHDMVTPLHNSTEGHQESDFFLYSRPLELPTYSPDNDDWNAVLMTCSAVLLFNLALTWHLIGIASLGCASIPLAKASRLYDLLLNFLDETIPVVVHPEPFLALECLVLNNLASLLRAHGDWDQYQGCLQVLNARLRTDTNALTLHLPRQEVQELLLNVLYATMSPSPAAATA
jgi:hypothetical protein